MKQRNTETRKKIAADMPIFQAVRRSDFPMQIRSKMIEKGLKNIDLAERLGVSEANISRWLRGNQNLSIDTMYLLADAVEEALTLALGSQIKDVDLTECAYEAIREESALSLDSSDQEAATPPDGAGAQVFHFSHYAKLSMHSGGRRATFASAPSESGPEINDLMVN